MAEHIHVSERAGNMISELEILGASRQVVHLYRPEIVRGDGVVVNFDADTETVPRSRIRRQVMMVCT